jgi:hypothetical protein
MLRADKGDEEIRLRALQAEKYILRRALDCRFQRPIRIDSR